MSSARRRRPSGLAAGRVLGRPGLVGLAVLALACGRTQTPPRGLRVGMATSISTLDPHAEGTIASMEQLANVYEPLVTLDSELRVRPCLASSWTNPDPVTWVFELKPDVSFHDGRPLTADDVVFSLRRLVGDEALRVRSYLATVADVSARDAHRAVIRTRWPDAQLLNTLSLLPIVPKGATAGTLERSPNGTGPFTVEAWEPRKRLRLRRNPRYWGPSPEFERVVVDFGMTTTEARDSLAAGRHDLLRYSSPSVAEEAERKDGYRVVAHPNIFLRHLAFDVERETTPFCPGIPNPFRRREVREAVGLALDRSLVARKADPAAVPATHLVPQAVFGFDPAARPPVHDVERARQLLVAAGFAQGFDVTLHRSGFEAAANEVKEQLARVGIRVTVARLESSAFFAALKRRELSFWVVANGCVTGDALELLWSVFHSPEPARGVGVDNYAGHRDPELDAMIEEAARRLDPSTRLPAIQRALGRVLGQNVWIPLYFSRDVFILRRSLSLRPRADGQLRYAEVGRAP